MCNIDQIYTIVKKVLTWVVQGHSRDGYCSVQNNVSCD